MSVVEFFEEEKTKRKIKTTQRSEYLDHKWQDRNSVTRFDQLIAYVGDRIAPEDLLDVEAGLKVSGMSIRLTPYILDLIDWQNVKTDPIRRQFLPMASELEEDHPCLVVDSLEEQRTSPAPNLVHRYPDKALFLVTSVCPVYCQFCTRSYAVGQDTETQSKEKVASPTGWAQALDYIRNTPELEDIVISGGDIARLKPQNIRMLGKALLEIDHIKRIRFASKVLSVQPMKVLSDQAWFDAIVEVAEEGRERFKSVFFHTHFNHPNEVTPVVEQAMRRFFAAGIFVRNQTVLLRGVNDCPETMKDLIKKLGRVNIQPYYVYACDMVKGTEHFRVALPDIQRLEREVRGTTAGFNTPLFIVDLPGGGGKRDVHSFEYRDDTHGITGYRAPAVESQRMFYYYDPLRGLDQSAQTRWKVGDVSSNPEALIDRKPA